MKCCDYLKTSVNYKCNIITTLSRNKEKFLFLFQVKHVVLMHQFLDKILSEDDMQKLDMNSCAIKKKQSKGKKLQIKIKKEHSNDKGIFFKIMLLIVNNFLRTPTKTLRLW